MTRLWGVLWGALGILATACADLSSSPMRTPNGMLWAGTTFQLRAIASMNNQVIALGSEAQVRVGQVIRWQWQLETPAGQSVPQGTDALFRVRVINDGNGYDNLNFGLVQYEVENSSAWTVTLFENPTGNGQTSGSTVVNGAGSVMAPGSDMLYLLRMRPPSSSVPTDGAWAVLNAVMGGGADKCVLGEFTAGVVRAAGVPARAWCYGNHVQHVAPVLYQGRLFWMGTDATSGDTRIFFTRDSIESTQGGTLGNERLVYGRVLRGFTPNGFSVAVGSAWFTGRGNQLIRVDLERVRANDTSGDPFSVVSFPVGVAPRLDLEPLAFNGRLYVVGSDNRIYAIREDGVRVGHSAAPPALAGTLSTNLVQIGRAIYAGTSNGWVLQFDLLTGALRTARRVSTQPVKSLATTIFGRQLLAQVGNRGLVGIHPAQMNILWQRTLGEDIVSPVVGAAQGEWGAVVTRSGNLWVFHTRMGVALPHYPQRVFGEQQLTRATLGFAQRIDRRVSYVYVLAQLETGNPNQQQALFRAVTMVNPYNRLEYNESTMHLGSEYLPWMQFTGGNSTSYCLVASRRADTYWGTVAAIPLR
ncbi:MAG: hypothetical protein ACK4RG_09080 [Fimbriimonadales bacterium]